MDDHVYICLPFGGDIATVITYLELLSSLDQILYRDIDNSSNCFMVQMMVFERGGGVRFYVLPPFLYTFRIN